MLREPGEIIKAYKTKSTELQELTDRFESDYGLRRMEAYQLGSEGEYDNYTSNEPRTLCDKVVERLATAPKQIRIPLELDNEEERKRKSNAERFIYGVENLANSRLQATIQPSIQEQLAYYSTLRGWFGIRAYIKKNEDEETIPDIAVWDIFNTRWEIGDDGLLWVIHTRPISKAQAEKEYKIENMRGKSLLLYDYWDGEVNSIVLGGAFVKKPLEHQLKYPPILIGMVGASPFIQSEKYTDTIKDCGESIYAADRNLFEPKNKLMTYYMTIVGQGAKVPMGEWTEDGKPKLTESPYRKGAVVTMKAGAGEEVKPLIQPTMPKDAAAILGLVNREVSIGGMPPIAGGELDFQLPYAGINLLIDAASSVLLPRQLAIERAYDWMGRELLTQYAAGGFKKLRLRGRDGSNEAFDVELSSEDIKGDWFPETKLMPQLPEDKPANYAMAQTAVVNKLLSRETAMDKHLGVQDTDAEMTKIWREEAMSLPPIQMMQWALALIQDGRPDLAQVLLEQLSQMGTQGGTPKGGGESEAVRPEFATGMPESVLPPEMMGRTQFPPGQREQIGQDYRLRKLGLERGA